MMEAGICKLCLENKLLLNEAHILPKFIFKQIRNEKKELYRISPNDMFDASNSKRRPSKGEVERGLFCKECDSILMGRYEDYAAKIIYHEHLPKSLRINGLKYESDGLFFTTFSNVDYEKFKLFILSMLWKSCVSSKPVFRSIRLENHEETLRKMILTGTPGKPEEFPILIYTWLDSPTISPKVIFTPSMSINRDSVVFPLGGMTYHIFTSINLINASMRPYILGPDSCTLFEIPKNMIQAYLKQFVGN